MVTSKSVDIMMIGHFAKDRIVVDGQAKIESGGAVYFGGIALQRMGLRVGVVTMLRAEDVFRLEEFRDAGVDVFAISAPETSGIENIYTSSDMERRTCIPLGFAGPFRQDKIPDLTASIISVVPIIAGEVDLPLLQFLAARAPIALDVQGFVRVREGHELVFRQWANIREGLGLVTYLKVDRAEAELLTGQTDMQEAARTLARYGPREIVITQSSGVTVFSEGEFYEAPFISQALHGRTGRGDTCFATYLGKRLHTGPQEACRFAAAVTSLKQELPGPWDGDREAVKRMLTQFEG